ncbi:hypothetical protein L593_07205 [Salinarchaeum sp. Harcht-Bsk1]|uniref:DUF4260 domain-containing protein n=1 Tax=Salinarchaeum sp. Harcht-Bsk1 TaxID=1333523 RepID=UPI0003424710|nr:DUF4260 domain-containing protein [Salinarchaeum sp. Harcht-Bsk1]AGN01388.1 hypothetical protein L593_07205 [Salinarchaeum sp. Harcht-Bsk1]
MDTRLYLRFEAVGIAVATIAAYQQFGGGLLLFVLLLFAPDVAAVGYLLGDDIGAVTYNLAHVYVWPLGLVGVGLWSGSGLAVSGGLIWTFHVAMDRSIGYGLKAGSFRETHLGRIGRSG